MLSKRSFQRHINRKNACPAAREWVSRQDTYSANVIAQRCRRSDWLAWALESSDDNSVHVKLKALLERHASRAPARVEDSGFYVRVGDREELKYHMAWSMYNSYTVRLVNIMKKRCTRSAYQRWHAEFNRDLRKIFTEWARKFKS